MSDAPDDAAPRVGRYGSRLLSLVIGTALAVGLAVLLLWHSVM